MYKILLIFLVFSSIIYNANAAGNEHQIEIENNGISKNIDAEQLFDIGNEYFKKNDFNKAIDLYKSALTIDNTKAKFYKNLAAAQIKIGKNKEAISNIESYLKLNPHSNDYEKMLKIKNHLQLSEIKERSSIQRYPNKDLEARIESITGNSVQVNIINKSDDGYYITLVDFIKFNSLNSNFNLTHSGSIAGNFELFSDPKDECIKGTIKPSNKTYVPGQSMYQVFLKPKDQNNSLNFNSSRANITMTLCSQLETETVGKIWTSQIKIGE